MTTQKHSQPTPGEGETPRTDAAKRHFRDLTNPPPRDASSHEDHGFYVSASFTRQLERELNAALRHPQELVEILRHAEEWMAEEGCDCGVDEPGTCALCEVREALSTYSSTNNDKQGDK